MYLAILMKEVLLQLDLWWGYLVPVALEEMVELQETVGILIFRYLVVVVHCNIPFLVRTGEEVLEFAQME